MSGQISFERLSDSKRPLHIHTGPLLKSHLATAANSADEYIRLGGYQLARRVVSEMTPDDVITEIDQAGLRGRAGGGFPAGQKWWLVSQAEAEEKYFICNANAVQAGGFKERFLLTTNPHRVIESVIIGAFAVNAKTAFIFLPRHFDREARILEQAVREARAHGFVGRQIFGSEKSLDIIVYRSLGGYVTGEETALMEMIEGKIGQPRGKPPLPTARGLFGAPTAVSNLETVLNASYILESGSARYQESGTSIAPGTLIFSLSGHVARPGLYELPLGASLRELIFDHGHGVEGGAGVKAVFPGGISSPALPSSSLDVALDFDSIRDEGSWLGSGTVIVVAEGTCMVDLTTRLAEFFHQSSCGKCQPCFDGTRRTLAMITRLDRIDEKSIDRVDSPLPPSLRKNRTLNVITMPAGVSYTDNAKGLDKIRHLAEFYKYRGDCHHSTEAASVIQSLLRLFTDEFEHHRLTPQCELGERTAYESIGA
ncbi:MAG TPA: NADH-ubiquinone oxidoreductase-F iron-sulfur binding region domain-containing protein [Blastocatellia bacterium]|nr:NADH-ubiquinone oxidoreductase-F iron-sulfur binding region domain-containing protein [Blastocatellia bacterium]